MLSNKPMKTRLAISGTTLTIYLAWLYFQQYLWIWFPSQYWNWIFIMSALGGAMVWSWTLPHPRQEQKRREKLEQLRQQAETEKLQTTETLAEKRP